jgi:predicted MarR family transcription regulator
VVKTFGDLQMAYMDDLNVMYPSVKLNKDELLDATKTAKKIVKELTQLNKSAKLPRSTSERIYLRTKYNGELNIYS